MIKPLLAIALCAVSALAQSGWRAATAKELEAAVPDRAPVVTERVETERTSMSGVADNEGHIIAAAVLITAGYSAAGKYSDFLTTQLPVTIGDAHLPAGNYLLGWTRSATGLDVQVYQAADGKPVAHIPAQPDPAIRKVEQVRIWPAPDGRIQIGRFAFRYAVDRAK